MTLIKFPKTLSCREWLIVVALCTGFTIGLTFLGDTIAQIAPGVPPQRLGVVTGIVASTTQTQGQQLLTSNINEIATVANEDDVVTVPPVERGLTVTIINNGANRLQIFPSTGHNYDHAATNAAMYLPPDEILVLIGLDTLEWQQIGGSSTSTWIDVPCDADNFTANGSMTWTVDCPGNQSAYRYSVMGSTMFLSWILTTTSIGGTPDTLLRMEVPGGYTISDRVIALYNAFQAGVNETGRAIAAEGDTFVSLGMEDDGDWDVATNTTWVRGQIFFPVTAP